MNYFWVNQKTTYSQEREGGYLWAPQMNENGRSFWHWKSLNKIQPGDYIFNNVNGAIRSYCIATSAAINAIKPDEITQNWEQLGWRVNATYFELETPIVISEHLETLRDLFPNKYSPYNVVTKSAIQIYLAELNSDLGDALASIGNVSITHKINQVERDAHKVSTEQIKEITAPLEPEPKLDESVMLTVTEKDSIVKHRVTQGKFRSDLIERYKGKCAITTLDVESLLIASHIKPWSKSNSQERNDPDNGLLLSVHLDKLFDRHLISFDIKGTILISKSLTFKQRDIIGLKHTMKLNNLTEGNQKYLAIHRKELV